MRLVEDSSRRFEYYDDQRDMNVDVETTKKVENVENMKLRKNTKDENMKLK